jgi:HSP20 family protein
MSWRRKKDEEKERLRKMFPWLPPSFFESSFFDEDIMGEDFLEQIMKEIERMMSSIEPGQKGIKSKKFGPFVWGYNFSIGPDGKPMVKEFGNIRSTGRGKPVASKDREPLVDVFIEDKNVRLVAELPGVSKTDIQVKATEDSISIEAKSGDRNYSTTRDLSVPIKPKTASAVYKNGILEITVERQKPAKAEEGFEIKIE